MEKLLTDQTAPFKILIFKFKCKLKFSFLLCLIDFKKSFMVFYSKVKIS